MSRHFFLSLMLGASLLATGCTTTATGVSASAVKTSAMPQTFMGEAPRGTTLAVVRYPAYVDTDTQDAFYAAFGQQVIGGSAGKYDAGSVELQGLADSVIVKSNYFALSLYKELAAKLPEHSVLLSPHVIKKAAGGSLISEPMTQAESLGNVLSIDFVSYTFPDSSKMMDKEPLSFGDLVTPLVTVRTDHRAAVPTQGLLLASRPLMSHAAANTREDIDESLSALQNGRLIASAVGLDFVAFLNGQAGFPVAQKALTRTGAVNAVRGYDVEKIKLDVTALKQLEAGEAGRVDPLETAFSKAFANQVVGILNRTDIEKASMAGRAAAISQFDESLAALTLVGTDETSYKTRLRYAERLLDAEKNYLSVQSLRLFDGVHNGEMGAQVRDMLKAEYDILEQRRALARQQNTAMALAVLGAVAAGAAIANDNGNSYGEQLAIDALISGAVYAGTRAYSFNQRSKGVGNNYLASVAPALEEQTTVQVSLIDSNETITAIRFEDLQDKLQALYVKNQRSLETIATSCGYAHTGEDKVGTWLGECSGGLGAGSGVGVLRKADGTSVEYYGYAKMGQPHGPGYMIHHGPTGSYAIEGTYNQGQPNGVMRVSRPAQADTLRNYSAGTDTGPAAAGSVENSPFRNKAAAAIN